MTFDDVLFTCCPPAPLDRAKFHTNALAGTSNPPGVLRSSSPIAMSFPGASTSASVPVHEYVVPMAYDIAGDNRLDPRIKTMLGVFPPFEVADVAQRIEYGVVPVVWHG